jgi:rod shape-determining protein MreD
MTVILSIPVMGFLTIIQSAVISRLPLSRGTADLVMVILVAIALQKSVTVSWQWSIVGGLFMDFFSGLPFGVFTFSYLFTTSLAVILRDRIWRFSFLMQLLIILLGTIFSHGITYVILFLQGANLPFNTTIQFVTLPSLILNFMLSFPIFILTRDVIEQFLPVE